MTQRNTLHGLKWAPALLVAGLFLHRAVSAQETSPPPAPSAQTVATGAAQPALWRHGRGDDKLVGGETILRRAAAPSAAFRRRRVAPPSREARRCRSCVPGHSPWSH